MLMLDTLPCGSSPGRSDCWIQTGHLTLSMMMLEAEKLFSSQPLCICSAMPHRLVSCRIQLLKLMF